MRTNLYNDLKKERRYWYAKLLKTEDIKTKDYINDMLVDIENQMREMEE